MNKRSRQATGQSPDGHRMTLVRRVLREPLPPAAAIRRVGRPGPGGTGAGKRRRPLWDRMRGVWTQGVGGADLRCVHTFIPAHPRRRGSSGSTKRLGCDGRDMRKPLGREVFLASQKFRPPTHSKLQAIALLPDGTYCLKAARCVNDERRACCRRRRRLARGGTLHRFVHDHFVQWRRIRDEQPPEKDLRLENPRRSHSRRNRSLHDNRCA